MKFPFNIDGRRVALAPAGAGDVYVWDRAWKPRETPNMRQPIWCGPCFLRALQKRHGPIALRRDQVMRSDVV
jgi:hypothetical protein